MLKILIFFLLFALSLAILSGLIYFWVEIFRKWRREDEAYNNKKRKEAFDEIKVTYGLFDDIKPTSTAEEQLREFEKAL